MVTVNVALHDLEQRPAQAIERVAVQHQENTIRLATYSNLAGFVCKERDFAKVVACFEDRHNGVGKFELGRAARIVLEKVHGKPLEGVRRLLKTHVGKCFRENRNNKRFQVFLNFRRRHV